MNWAKALALAISLSCFASSQEVQAWQPSSNHPGSSMQTLTAKVDQVFKMVDEGGYQFIAYQVTYNGQSVIVSDPINHTALSVGSDLKFLAVRIDLPDGGKKLISFIIAKTKN